MTVAGSSHKGLAQHACERTTHKTDRRTFQPYPNLALPKGTCFVIAEHGAAYAKALLASEAESATILLVLEPSPEPGCVPRQRFAVFVPHLGP